MTENTISKTVDGNTDTLKETIIDTMDNSKKLCPYCQQEMEKGYIQNCWGDLRWTPQDRKRGVLMNHMQKGEIPLILNRCFKKGNIEVNRCPNCHIEIIDETKTEKVNVIYEYVIVFLAIIIPICYFWWKFYPTIKLVDVTDLSAVLETESPKYYYFGNDSCEYCKQFELNLDLVYEALPGGMARTIYYIDTEYWAKEEPEEFNKICTEFEINAVPRLIEVQNKEIVTDVNVIGILTDGQEEGIISPYNGE